MDALELPGGVQLQLVPEGRGWNLVLRMPTEGAQSGDAAVQQQGDYTGQHDDPAQHDDAGQRDDEAALAAARWLVDRLADHSDGATGVSPAPRLQAPGLQASGSLVPGFQVQRFLRPAPPPAGERLIGVDQTNRSVIVGDQVVVKWLRRIDDQEHPALTALAHLAEVRFAGTPATFGTLTWQPPRDVEAGAAEPATDQAATDQAAMVRGRTRQRAATAGDRWVPLGFATALLPDALDGWEWCLTAFESADRDFPGAIGRLTAQLHVAFATASTVLPVPTTTGGADLVRRWHSVARKRLAEVVERIGELDDVDAGPDGDRARHTPSEVIKVQCAGMEAAIDRMLDVQGPTPLQRIHGDLHVGQVLRWAGGLAVIDFDGNPISDDDHPSNPDPSGQPASTARDVAQLMISLDQVGRIIDRQSGFTRTAEVDDWSRWARAELLTGYLDELARLGRAEIFDTRLVQPFAVEQGCRDLLYCLRFLPRWAYATIDGLALILSN